MKFDILEKFPNRIEIKKSWIKEAWLWAYSQINIPKNTTIWEYIGKIINPDDFDNKKSHHDYGFSVYDKWKVLFVIDSANKKYGNWTRYINCARSSKEENVYFYQYKKRIFIKTHKEIKKWDELFVWYGKEYGVKLNGVDIYS